MSVPDKPGEKPEKPRGEGVQGVLGTIRNPLVFFALALLIIEGIFGLTVTKSKMTGDQQFYCMMMAGLFVVVIAFVGWITIKWPTHLYEDITQVTRDVHDLKTFVESTAFRDVVIDILEEQLPSKHLQLSPQTPEKETAKEAALLTDNPRDKEVNGEQDDTQ